jgi:hypothetical protein
MGRFDEKVSFLITELAFFVRTKRPMSQDVDISPLPTGRGQPLGEIGALPLFFNIFPEKSPFL